MRRLLSAVAPCILLPVSCFVVLSYQSLDRAVNARLPLLTAYYISSQLDAEIGAAQSREPNELAPNYQRIIQDYRGVLTNKEVADLEPVSSGVILTSSAEALVAKFVLWRENLPTDFLSRDPVKDLVDQLNSMRDSERRNSSERENIIIRHSLDLLRQSAVGTEGSIAVKRGLPPETLKDGLVFCGEKIPVDRMDVRRRIEYQIAYLLADFRETTGIWLKRKDRYGEAIKRILERENIPIEFSLLPALESGYSRKVVSPSMAGGWWQFVRPTAIQSLSKERDLDWSLQVDSWKDERRDLALSTRSAARYLKWIRSKLGNGSTPGSWLTSAAAYNAGLSEIKYRTVAYSTDSYWDMKLPAETEDYVPRWIALYIIDANRHFYGMEMPEISPISFDTLEGIHLTRDLPLHHLAAMAECSVSFLREINSAVEKGEISFRATRNNSTVSHTIHLPNGCKEQILGTLKARMYLRD
ncbi:MAG: lytic transglycosylase domain-containing protein [Desulfomonile tiedjei]|uniref:Lytic transglycosylase domain-containing protein n=1 Tax=Desulfomonile tiedjei TaxID=2358 RepID=A0A9D6V6I7_9BACT|nr:lytic transglycosylase domain-containing protein [Desulfomonile tiedjei]